MSMGTGVKLGVLASGSGTNLQAIIDAGLPVAVVVTDRPGVAALDRAAGAGIPTAVVDRAQHLPDRVAFTEGVIGALRAHDVDLVAMAGFMTVLAEPMFAAFPDKVINTHPSLLPSFRGAHAVAEALAAGVRVTGCTIHIATVEVDDGPILAQEPVPVLDGDDEQSLHERIKAVEHRLYPRVLRALVAGSAAPEDEAPSADGPVPVRRALISVYDKTGLVDFARGLADLGVTLLASGGTSVALAEAGIPVTPVETVTGAPEMLGGRVKTLHPRIHGGILADRGQASHRADLAAQGIEPIDLVVVNLYPFLERPSIETIDIGGPTMVRAAAKNHAWVGVVTDPGRYDGILEELRTGDGRLSAATRADLALEAFAHTAGYDAAIVRWFDADPLPRHLVLPLEKVASLRYGENPHQAGARYRDRLGGGWLDGMVQDGGKELSFINLLDSESAWRLVNSFDVPACVIVKHANPCGVALGDGPADAYRKAFECDPLSAFGGVVALNRLLDEDTAAAIGEVFTEVVLAPGFAPAALEAMAGKKNLRLLECPPYTPGGIDLRRAGGGFLVQETDPADEDRSTWKVVTKVAPTDEQMDDMAFAMKVCAATGSNAIVLARGGVAYGIGAGQQSRVHSAEMAAKKADGRARGGVCASDAFFPFRDGVDTAVAAGAAAIVQPGGSVGDEKVIAAADEAGAVMVFTGRRHFRH
ncbi:MAG TPA: bifunctional phosphoribosylaminoimidazolecarboxamide formyltransferase/IMP cyclohydrolase [Acidimicrobiia bacterium]|nr:bifunctional phosphoribosylaminoimidazolecarboxamide formyltransferase/IMP cyclohydrolase [Acidimicrobiia bacterium]